VPWLTQRTAAFWPEPNAFKPERFVGGKRPEPYTYIPFAIGPRICPGLAFGLVESVLLLATLAQRFRLQPSNENIPEPVSRLTLRPSDGLPLKVYHR
jgi:cytochrome P450